MEQRSRRISIRKRRSAITEYDNTGNEKEECRSPEDLNERSRPNLQAQKEAERVYSGAEDVLYSSGKHLHLKKLANQHSVSQKNTVNGVIVHFDTDRISWLGLNIPFDLDKDDPYIAESIRHKLKYSEIIREEFMNGYHYYLNLYFDGDAFRKLKSVSQNKAGIDPGVSTMACVSDSYAGLMELAPLSENYNRRIFREQRLITRSVYLSIPDNYVAYGIPKTGRHKWHITSGCARRKRKLRFHRAT